MAVDNSQKKTAFLSRIVANQKAFAAARAEATALRELSASDAVDAGIVDADCVSPNQHLTAAIVTNYLGITSDIEKCLTNQAVVTSNRLPSFLAPGNS